MADAKQWTDLHDLAYVFLALAHGADGDFAKEEQDVVVERIVARDPLSLKKGARELLNFVAKHYQHDRRNKDKRRLQNAIKRLRKNLDTQDLQEAFNDLLAISQADGVILDSEWAFLDAIKGAWGVTAS